MEYCHILFLKTVFLTALNGTTVLLNFSEINNILPLNIIVISLVLLVFLFVFSVSPFAFSETFVQLTLNGTSL